MGRIPKIAETECIAMFRRVLGGVPVLRGHTFDFLCGDPTPNRPLGTSLPVDAYFPDFNLVIEYLGRQHFEGSRLFDRRPGRADQRRKYQARRTDTLTQHGVRIVCVRYDELLTEEIVMRKLVEVGINLEDPRTIG